MAPKKNGGDLTALITGASSRIVELLARRFAEGGFPLVLAMLAHFLPSMVARGQGRVLNVASTAAFHR